jgi:hypothetical protein
MINNIGIIYECINHSREYSLMEVLFQFGIEQYFKAKNHHPATVKLHGGKPNLTWFGVEWPYIMIIFPTFAYCFISPSAMLRYGGVRVTLGKGCSGRDENRM